MEMTNASVNNESVNNEKEVLEGKPVQSGTVEWTTLGGKILAESISIGREYSKFMVRFSFGAIPIYILLLKDIKFDVYQSSMFPHVLFLLMIYFPIILFLISSVLFIIAYYPKKSRFILDNVEEIQSAYMSILNKRRYYNIVGTIVFVLSVILSGIILIYKIYQTG